MTAAWVAASVRARLLARRRVGMAGARALASAPTSDAAVEALTSSPYGRSVRTGSATDEAVRAVGSVCVWHLRVLAGWAPPQGAEVMRVFAARYELANIAGRFAELAGGPASPLHELGALAVVSPRLAGAATPEDLRAVLVASVWGDPGVAGWPGASPALEARWANWLAAAVPWAPAWSAGAAALVAAGLLASGRRPEGAARRELRRALGGAWEGARDVPGLAQGVPRAAAWALADMSGDEDVWRGTGRWWGRVDGDAARTLRSARPGPPVVAAAAARLAADAWRVGAALEATAWGDVGLEAFDALA